MSDGDIISMTGGEHPVVPTRPLYGRELDETCEAVRGEYLPTYSEDDEDTVELTPDGQAVMDGAFTAYELMRITEAVQEAVRRCAKGTGLTGAPTEGPPQAFHALHALVEVSPIPPGAPGWEALLTLERAIWRLTQAGVIATADMTRVLANLEQANAKLAAVGAIVEAQARAARVGGEIGDPVVIGKLAEILGG